MDLYGRDRPQPSKLPVEKAYLFVVDLLVAHATIDRLLSAHASGVSGSGLTHLPIVLCEIARFASRTRLSETVHLARCAQGMTGSLQSQPRVQV